MEDKEIKVMIVDDIPSLCHRYQDIFEHTQDMKVVSVAHNGYEAVLKSAVTRPDVILMDIEMESRYAGITATQQILSELPEIKIIILTVYEEEFKRIKDQEESLIYNLYLIQLLTDTERDILSALHEGLSQKEVCKQRYIGTATMKTHIRNILQKMKCKSIEDVLQKADSSGFFYYMEKVKERQAQKNQPLE